MGRWGGVGRAGWVQAGEAREGEPCPGTDCRAGRWPHDSHTCHPCRAGGPTWAQVSGATVPVSRTAAPSAAPSATPVVVVVVVCRGEHEAGGGRGELACSGGRPGRWNALLRHGQPATPALAPVSSGTHPSPHTRRSAPAAPRVPRRSPRGSRRPRCPAPRPQCSPRRWCRWGPSRRSGCRGPRARRCPARAVWGSEERERRTGQGARRAEGRLSTGLQYAALARQLSPAVSPTAGGAHRLAGGAVGGAHVCVAGASAGVLVLVLVGAGARYLLGHVLPGWVGWAQRVGRQGQAEGSWTGRQGRGGWEAVAAAARRRRDGVQASCRALALIFWPMPAMVGRCREVAGEGEGLGLWGAEQADELAVSGGGGGRRRKLASGAGAASQRLGALGQQRWGSSRLLGGAAPGLPGLPSRDGSCRRTPTVAGQSGALDHKAALTLRRSRAGACSRPRRGQGAGASSCGRPAACRQRTRRAPPPNAGGICLPLQDAAPVWMACTGVNQHQPCEGGRLKCRSGAGALPRRAATAPDGGGGGGWPTDETCMPSDAICRPSKRCRRAAGARSCRLNLWRASRSSSALCGSRPGHLPRERRRRSKPHPWPAAGHSLALHRRSKALPAATRPPLAHSSTLAPHRLPLRCAQPA